MTVNQTHIDYAVNGSYQSNDKADHIFTENDLKNLPKYIADPAAIIASESQPDTSIVEILDFKSINGKRVIAAVVIDGFGRMHGNRINSHAITTVHGRKNTLRLLENAFRNEAKGQKDVFYQNKNKIRALQRAGLQLPSGLPSESYIHSIFEDGVKVNSKFKNQTETLQFKRWFKGSKIVDENRTPKKRTSYVFEKNGLIYPVDLHIARTRDGRNVLYAVNVNMKNGVPVDKGATPIKDFVNDRHGGQNQNANSIVKKVAILSTKNFRLRTKTICLLQRNTQKAKRQRKRRQSLKRWLWLLRRKRDSSFRWVTKTSFTEVFLILGGELYIFSYIIELLYQSLFNIICFLLWIKQVIFRI